MCDKKYINFGGSGGRPSGGSGGSGGGYGGNLNDALTDVSFDIGDSVFAGQGWQGVALGVKVLNSNLI